MLKNYLLVVLRNLIKHTAFSFINIFGLALGLACFAFIAIYVMNERGFDRFHPDGQRLYRINKIVRTDQGTLEKHGLTAGLLAPALEETFPTVEQTVRLQPWFNPIRLSAGDRSVISPEIVFADDSFFDIFGFELLRGDPATVLSAPKSIVLTESEAEALFGEADPIGQTVSSINNVECVVTGIAREPNPHSHLSFSALVSWSTTVPGNGGLEFDWMNRWITQAPFTYVRLISGTDPEAFEEQLPSFYADRDPERAEKYTLVLQPISDVYLGSADIRYVDQTRRGNIGYVRALSVVALLVLVIACINFVNLSTARASFRFREVGLRKVFGARRIQLERQFLFEAVFYAVLALILALAAVEVVSPWYEALAGQNMIVPTGLTLPLFGLMLGTALLVGLVSGFWPALKLSRTSLTRSLAGRSTGLRRARARNVFVTFQFAISMVLVAGSMIVVRQLSYLLSMDLGFQGEQLVVLDTDDTDIQDRFEAFRTRLEASPAIVETTGSTAVPGTPTMTINVLPEGHGDESALLANVVRVDDFSLVDTYGFEMDEGRYFNPEFPTDEVKGVVINRTLANALGWDDPVGKRLDIQGELQDGVVLGVVEDFHFASLRESIEPLAFYYAPRGATMTVRVADGHVQEALAHMESVWKEFENGFPFKYSFLDETFARFYEREARLRTLLSVFAGLAVFIACLGLYGLASYMTAVRTREVGIRKVLGAGSGQIVRMFIREFAVLVCIAILVSIPVILIGADRWLSGFAYRISAGPGDLFTAAAFVLFIALVSAAWHPLRAALANPVDALRTE